MEVSGGWGWVGQVGGGSWVGGCTQTTLVVDLKINI